MSKRLAIGCPLDIPADDRGVVVIGDRKALETRLIQVAFARRRRAAARKCILSARQVRRKAQGEPRPM